MSFKKIISTKNFWTSVLIFAGIFVVLYNIIRVILEFDFNFGAYFSFHFEPDHLFNFILSNLIGGFIYGFVVVYFKYWRHYKEKS